MKIAIIVSEKDVAGMNIKQNLIEYFKFNKTTEIFQNHEILHNKEQNVKLYTLNQETTEFDNIDLEIEANLFIYATRHQSKSGIPSLSTHCTGNWSKAEMGGKDNYLCMAPSKFMKEAMIYMQKNYQKHEEIKDFDIIQEVTHHGPYLEKPIMFIEIGSNEKEWKIPEAGKFIAETIMYLLENREDISNKPYKTAIGIGGPHATSNFKKIILGKEYALSHVCPKYMLDYLTKELIEQAIESSTKKAEVIILDWKGLGENKSRILEFLEEIELPKKKTKDFSKTLE
jgi:D-aminoacyl-tRNA deacylase